MQLRWRLLPARRLARGLCAKTDLCAECRSQRLQLCAFGLAHCLAKAETDTDAVIACCEPDLVRYRWSGESLQPAAQFHWERDSGNLLLYITAPVGLGAIALGMAIGGALGVVIRAVIITVAGVLLFGAKYQVADPFLLALVILAGVAAMYSLGVCLSSVFLISGREADHLGSLLNEPMQLLGGVYAPVRSMGTVGVVALGILPLAPAIDALRQVAVPQLAATGILPVGVELLILLVMTIVFGVIGRVLLAHIERVGRAGGKLLARAD